MEIERDAGRFEFRECPKCFGYGVRDNGANCVTCGGVGDGGVYPILKAHLEKGNVPGSGDIIIERETGRVVSLAEFMAATGGKK